MENNKLIKIGKVNWNYDDIKMKLDDFLILYKKRPIYKNIGGMGAPHCFATYFLLIKLQKKYIVESGIWKGQSTWLIENTCPKCELICIDPNLNNRKYISNKAKYTTTDWEYLTLTNPKETLCFFDDHQNALNRIKHAISKGFKHLIFEDNYPIGQGDCISLKQLLSKNNAESKFLKKHIEIYYEFPPIFKKNKTRWGDNWDDINYPTQKPIFSDLKNNEKYKIFYDDADGYTWLAYVKLF